MNIKSKLEEFIEWYESYCTGDEKGEAQIFLDRLFKAFGHEGILDIGGKTEFRIKMSKTKSTTFADS